MGCPFDPGDAVTGRRTPLAQRGVSPSAFAQTALAIGGSDSLEQLREHGQDVPEVTVYSSLGAIVRGRPAAQHAWPPQGALASDALTGNLLPHHLLVGCRYDGSDPADDRDAFETALRAVEGAAAGVEDVLGVTVGYTTRYLDRYAGGADDRLDGSSASDDVDCWLHLASDAAWLVLTAELALFDGAAADRNGDEDVDVEIPFSAVERRAVHARSGELTTNGEHTTEQAPDGGTEVADDGSEESDGRTEVRDGGTEAADDGSETADGTPATISAGPWAGGVVATVARHESAAVEETGEDGATAGLHSPLAHVGVETSIDGTNRSHAVVHGTSTSSARDSLPEDPDWNAIDVLIPPRDRRVLPTSDRG